MDERLTTARAEIQNVDAEMALLFQKRMKAVEVVTAYKKDHGLPILDAEREAFLLEENARLVEDEVLRSYYKLFLRDMMDVSKQYQTALTSGMRVAYCGVEGAFAAIAAKRIFPAGFPVSYGSFSEAYESVRRGACDCCVLPVENSYAGEVGEVLDLMYRGSLSVSGVYSLPIIHNLLGTQNAVISDVRTVISHPQALIQCAGYIHKNGFEPVAASNTAVAAKTVAEKNDVTVAAVASEETAALFGLKILDHNVNESGSNTTRFAVFSRGGLPETKSGGTFILLFTLRNEVGALAKAVNIISSNGFDMRVLRSRPVKNIPWQYYFYVEAVGDQNSDEGRRMLRALSVCCEELKVVGSFTSEIDLFDTEAKG